VGKFSSSHNVHNITPNHDDLLNFFPIGTYLLFFLLKTTVVCQIPIGIKIHRPLLSAEQLHSAGQKV